MGSIKLNSDYYKNRNFKIDSRGNVINPYDKLLFLNTYANSVLVFFAFLNEDNDLDSLIQKSSCLGFVQTFKLTDEEFMGMQELASGILNADSSSNLDYTESKFNYILEKREELYKTKNNKSNLRGLEMIEITGKQLNIGDLVIYFKNDKVDYGVVYSSNKLLLEDFSTITVRSVFKPLNLSEDEISFRFKLQEYMMKSRTVNLNKFDNLERGMVFSSKDNIYIYFGVCNINEVYLGITRYKIEFKFPNDKELYLRVPMSYLETVLNDTNKLFNELGNLGIVWPSRTVKKSFLYENYLKVQYNSVEEIDMFVDKIEKNLKYWGKINLSNILYWRDNIGFNIQFLN